MPLGKRPAQYPWVTNVLFKLLDVGGSDMPKNFADQVTAIFDTSRRDLELLKEIGFTPFILNPLVPAVAGNFSVLDWSVVAGSSQLAVITNVVNSSGVTAFGWHWSNGALVAPGAVPVQSRDQRLGPLAIGGELRVQQASLAAIPPNRFWHTNIAASPAGGVLVAPTDATGNHLQLVGITANTLLGLSIEGYFFSGIR